MRIVFKKIPKLAIYFYVVGFLTISLALYLFFTPPALAVFPVSVTLPQIQQLFIGGAIVVAIGSVINNLSQFKKN